MKKEKLVYLLGFCSVFFLSGCVVRTYQATRDRVDQDLSEGNRGYLTGVSTAEEKERKPTRTTQVVEVELRPLLRFEKASKAKQETVSQPVSEESMYGENEFEGAVQEPAVNMQKYTVQKGDTLQKISSKYFGTTKKWMKIYDANRDILKGPDKIRPGQVINIPVTPEQMKEPPQNLK